MRCQMDIFIIVAKSFTQRSARWVAAIGDVFRYEKSLEKCRGRAAITGASGLRVAADKTGARSVRAALTTCRQFMLRDKQSLFSLRVANYSAELHVAASRGSSFLRPLLRDIGML